MFLDILRVGAVASFSPLQTVLTVLILTRLVASFGTEALAGYGIGARLEFLLVPIAFAVGVACVPMVGMAIGAGDVARARRVAWTGAGVSACAVGLIGLVVAAVPQAWSGRFTSDPGVLAAADLYLRLAGPAFVFVGLGLVLYFASQGAGKVLGPVLAATVRLARHRRRRTGARDQRRAGMDAVCARCRVDGGLRRRNSGGGALHALAGARPEQGSLIEQAHDVVGDAPRGMACLGDDDVGAVRRGDPEVR